MFHVKHSIEKTLQELKIEPETKKVSTLLKYIEELIKWNKKINFISRKLTEEEVFAKLIFPSLIPINVINEGEKILDFGAGGGIASIPLKIFKPQITLHLLESKNKPVIFLEHISSLLNLNLKIINKFVKKEHDLEERYDWIFIRAVNPEKVPQGLARKIVYYGKYSGKLFRKKDELSFKGITISVLERQCFT